MPSDRRRTVVPHRSPLSLLATALGAALAAGPGARAQAPDAPAAERVPAAAPDFLREVRPLLVERCGRCHADGRDKGRLSLETRAGLLEGGKSGPAIVPGNARKSLLIRLVSGEDPDREMPARGDPLTGEQVSMLRRWIDAGAPWPDGIALVEEEGRGLALDPPALPGDAEGVHPVDRLLAPYLEAHDAAEAEPAGDRVFCRRVYLDVIGLLPSEAELARYLEDDRPGRDRRLVRRLLAQRDRYAAHWLTFWNDALRNDYRGTGYIDGGRKQITSWLHEALRRNLPYDEFVRQLIRPAPGAEGFLKGIVWRGVVNASQRPEMQAAQNLSQVFLGINLKCASCHDSFVNEWKLRDAYAFANVFAEEPLEIHRCDKPMGETAATRFLYPELGTIDAGAPLDERRAQLAEVFTKPENGRFARTIVNRLWARFLGRGLIEPLDDIQGEAWHPGLLEWLAQDLVEHGWDLQHTMERILTSGAYRRRAVDGGGRPGGPDYVFRGPLVRRMSAEQFIDAVSGLCGVTLDRQAQFVPPPGAEEASAALAGGELSAAHTSAGLPGHGFIRYRSEVVREGAVEIDVSIEGARTLWLVVRDGGDGRDWDWAGWAEPRIEGPAGTKPLTGLDWRRATTGHGEVRIDRNAVDHPLRLAGETPEYGIGTHAHSVIVYDLPSGYTRFRATAGPDTEAVESSETGHSVRFLVLTDVQVRTAFTAAGSLQRALGRPNREQVVTRRDSTATTLQALELTNGDTLDGLLRRGAARWVERGQEARGIVEGIWRHALGRKPGEEELARALEVTGDPPAREGVQDLLWIVAMLPEFQLIR